VDPAIIDEFCQEATIMKQLRHPNLTLFLGVCLEDPTICILTEYVSRGSLFDLLHDEHAPFTWQRGLRILCDVAQGMTYLHAAKPRPILHRDLKSLNILVDENWRGKVADFGMSRFHDAGATMTQCGSPLWMAPEMVRNMAYDEKSDVYSFGICLWEIYTRKIPYRNLGLAPSQLVVKVVKEHLRPQIPPTMLKPYQKLIERCWHPNPEKRPVFSKIVEALEAFLLDPTVMAHTPGSTRQGVMVLRNIPSPQLGQYRTEQLADDLTQRERSWLLDNWREAVLVDRIPANDRVYINLLRQQENSPKAPSDLGMMTPLSNPVSTPSGAGERKTSQQPTESSGRLPISVSFTTTNEGTAAAANGPTQNSQATNALVNASGSDTPANGRNLPVPGPLSIVPAPPSPVATPHAPSDPVPKGFLPEFWPDCYIGKYRGKLVLIRKMLLRAPGAPPILIQQLQERKQTHHLHPQDQAFRLRSSASSSRPRNSVDGGDASTASPMISHQPLTLDTDQEDSLYEFTPPDGVNATLPPGQHRLDNILSDDVLVVQIKDALAQCASLRHPNLAMFMGAYLAPNHVGIIHELPIRGTLQGLLLDTSILIDWETSISILIDIAQVMTYLYACRPPRVPQDLSSASFLVDTNWRIKLLNPVFSSLDQFIYGGHTVPTPWSAPETLEHASMLTPASHVYSFAIILWQLFARRPVYGGQWDGRTLRAVAHDALRPKVPSSMPAPLVTLLTQCWSEKPQQRPTFHEILQRLQQLRDEGPPKMTLIQGVNAERYRKATTVFAYRTADPITIIKDWGKSVGNAGDYIVHSPGDDVYVVDSELFKRTYEPVRGSEHEYRKVGTVLARMMEEPFVVRSGPGGSSTEFGYVGDYLVQNAAGDQWVVEGKVFKTLYELDQDTEAEVNPRRVQGLTLGYSTGAETPRSPLSSVLAATGGMQTFQHNHHPNRNHAFQSSAFTFNPRDHAVKE